MVTVEFPQSSKMLQGPRIALVHKRGAGMQGRWPDLDRQTNLCQVEKFQELTTACALTKSSAAILKAAL